MNKADDGKPGESLGETETKELQATKTDLESRMKDKPDDQAMQARHKAIAAELKKRAGKTDMEAEKACKKSEENMSGIETLATWGQEPITDPDAVQKAQSMPEGDPKQKLGAGEEQGGKLAGVGMTSGDNTSGPGPGQDAKGQVTGTKLAKDKLSEDEKEDEANMKPHKKPIETAKSESSARPLSIPQAQREQVMHENALAAQELQKAEEDVEAGTGKGLEPKPEPELEKGRVGLQGMVQYSDQSDIEAEALLKSDDFYTGGSPSVTPFTRPIGVGKVCPRCETALSKSLSACPKCGLGTVVHRVIPGGEAQGDHDGEVIVKSRSGKLRPRRAEKDVKFD